MFDVRLSQLLQNYYQVNTHNLMLKLLEAEDGVEIAVKTILDILEEKQKSVV